MSSLLNSATYPPLCWQPQHSWWENAEEKVSRDTARRPQPSQRWSRCTKKSEVLGQRYSKPGGPPLSGEDAGNPVTYSLGLHSGATF